MTDTRYRDLARILVRHSTETAPGQHILVEAWDTPETMIEALLAEIRAWMGRRQVNQTDMARHMGLTRSAVSRRMSGQQDFTFPELASIAGWLDITLAELVGPVVLQARRSPRTDMVGAGASGSLPRLDSNQQPFD